MLALKHRTSEEGVRHHVAIEPRVYENDDIQRERIEKSREMVMRATLTVAGVVTELGGGTGDICGPLSRYRQVRIADCSPAAILAVERRFPYAVTSVVNAETEDPWESGIIVLCEVLEHTENPAEIVRRWLPRSCVSVISHPLNEPEGSSLSGGDHQWSFSEEDFDNWFRIGGHTLVEKTTFRMGAYTIILGRGMRNSKV